MQPSKHPLKPTKQSFLNKGANNKQVKIIQTQPLKPKTGFTQFPTAKLMSIKTIDPFCQKKGNSFAHLYSSGSIPCKIQHGSVNMKLKWNANVVISQLPYHLLLIACLDGLIQEKHPYGFIAYHVSKEMIQDQNSAQKLIQLLTKIVWPLRTALTSSNQQICLNSLQILKLLSNKVGSHLNSHVKNLVTPIKKHMSSKKLKQKALETLRSLQDNGGQEVNKIIKGSIPTYSNY